MIYLQKEGIIPVYSEAKAVKLEEQGWKRVDISLLWAEEKAESKKTSLTKKEVQLLLYEKGITYPKKAKLNELRSLL